MKKITKKSTKLTIKISAVVFSVLMLAVSCIGIYFGTRKKSPAPTVVNPIDFSIDVWDGKTSSASDWVAGNNYANRGDMSYTIDSAESFIHFKNIVNNEASAKEYNYFKGYTVYLNQSVDLSGYKIESLGVKITHDDGSVESTFQGTFDGGYYTIYNGSIKGNGLFGYVENATIKNVGLYNVNIKGNGEYVGGIAGTAINTNISDTYVRLGKVSGPVKLGGLVGNFVSNNGTHSIENSFVDSTLKAEVVYGIAANISTNSSIDNKVSILNSYYTGADDAYYTDVTGFVTNESMKAEYISNFDSWDYGSYSENKTWCDYSYIANSRELNFRFPILSNFNKVFMTGSFYEGTSYNETTGEVYSTSSISQAFDMIAKEQTGEVNIIVEKVFMQQTAIASAGSIVEFKSLVDTEVIRAEENEGSFIVTAPNSALTIGEEGENAKAITFDGNREYVEANNIKSDAAIVSTSSYFKLGSDVTIKNNINNTSGYGGGLSLISTEAEFSKNVPVLSMKHATVVENCSSEKHGGGVYINGCFGFVDSLLGLNVSGCSVTGSGYNGGGLYLNLSKEAQQESPYAQVLTRYLKSSASNVGLSYNLDDKIVIPSGTPGVMPDDVGISTIPLYENVFYYGEVTGCTNSNGCGGAAYFGIGSYTVNLGVHGSAPELIGSETEDGTARFTWSTATAGGGVFAESGSSTSGRLNIYSVILWWNIATGTHGAYERFNGRGAGMYLACNTYATNYFRIDNCKADNDGGGIVFNGCASTTGKAQYDFIWEGNPNQDNYIVNCGAQYGSGIYFAGAAFKLSNVKISNNGNGNSVYGATYSAAQYGGAIHVNGRSNYSSYFNGIDIDNRQIIGDGCLLNNNSAAAGGGSISTENNKWWSSSYALDNPSIEITGSGIQINNNTSSGGSGAIRLGTGTLTVCGSESSYVNFSGNSSVYGGAIYAGTNAINVTLANFISNTATAQGGAIRGDNVTVSTSAFIGNSCPQQGGAICAAGPVNATNCTFTNNKSTGSTGGAVHCYNSTFTGCTFLGNSSAAQGGALDMHNTCTITDCYFGITADGATTSGNVAGYWGGAIAGYEDSIITITGSNFTSNSTTTYSGGAIGTDGNITIDKSTFTNNVSNTYGGALVWRNAAKITNSTFTGNKANSNFGGAVGSEYATATLELSGSTFTSNTASTYGGAVAMPNGATVVNDSITDCTFTGNSAYYGGAVGFASIANTTINFTSCTFTENSAGTDCGGGILVMASVTTTLNLTDTTMGGNKAITVGGAVYIYDTSEDLSAAHILNVNTGYYYGNEAPRGGAFSSNTANFTLNIGTASDSTNENLIIGGYYDENSELVVSGNKATGTSSSTGLGGVYAHATNSKSKETVTITKGTIIGNSSGYYGGAFYLKGYSGSANYSYLYTKGGIFKQNSAKYGGAIYTSNYSNQYIYAGKFEGNRATRAGGAIYAISNVGISYVYIGTNSFYSDGVVFDGNSASTSGGAVSGNISIGYSGCSADHVTFKNNTATYGGAIYATYIYSLYNATFEGNKATGSTYGGSAICLNTSSSSYTCTIPNITLTNNEATTGGAFHIRGYATVNITNITASGNKGANGAAISTAAYTSGATSYYPTINITGTASFTNNTATSYGGAIYVIGSGTLTLSGTSTFTGNTASSGGAIYTSAASTTLTGATFKNNTAGSDGGAIYVDGSAGTASLAVNGATFTGNTAEFNGGAIEVYEGDLTISDKTTFTDNTADIGWGGAIDSSGDITISGETTFTGNTASSSGSAGAIYNSEGTLTFDPTGTYTFENNTSDSGGAIVNNGGTLTLAGNATFKGNQANSGSGGAINDLGTFTWDSAGTYTFENNSAANGGAISTNGSETLNISGTATFTGNTSTSTDKGGGAIYAGRSITFADSCTYIFENNSATTYAGAIYNNKGTLTFNAAATFTGNSAKYAGAIYNGGTIVLYADSVFTDNTASSTGGAILNNGGTLDLVGNATFTGNKCTSSISGAIYNNGTLTFAEGGTYTFENNTAKTSGGAIYTTTDLTLSGEVTFTGNTAGEDGGAIFTFKAISLPSGTTFTSNSATNEGGAICADDSITITGATFSENISGSAGGAICVGETTYVESVEIESCTFTGNSAAWDGGAVSIWSGSATISNSSFNNNTVTKAEEGGYGGGAIQVYGGNVTINGETTFTENSSDYYGGAIIITNEGTLNLAGNVTFEGNSSGSGGGAIYLENGTLTLDSTGTYTFENNTAQSSGGAIYTATDLEISGETTFTNNSATSYGGAIYIAKDSTVDISDSATFTGNTASSGGAIDNNGTLRFADYGTYIFGGDNEEDGNSAPTCGGAISNGYSGASEPSAVLSLAGYMTFKNNSSVNGYGGAIATFGTTNTSDIGDFTFINNSARYGGAIDAVEEQSLWNCSFIGNSADTQGGAVNSYQIHFKDPIFENNTATDYGGAIYASGDVEISSIFTFTGNSASNGGAIYLSSGNLTMNNSSGIDGANFTGNTATYYGGAIYASGGTLDIAGEITFAENKATSGEGGAIYAGGAITLADSGTYTFENNEGGKGGAICIGGTLTLSGTSNFTGNSGTSGGAIYAGGDITFDSTGTYTFSNNTASESGGAIYATDDIIFAEGGTYTFENNIASTDGGAIYASYYLDIYGDTTFTGNKAEGGDGGAICMSGSTLCTYGTSTFTNNSASGNGGAIYNGSTTGLYGENTFTGNSASNGGAIYLDNGTLNIANSVKIYNNTATYYGGGIYRNAGTVNFTEVTSLDELLSIFNETDVDSTNNMLGGDCMDSNSAGTAGNATYGLSTFNVNFYGDTLSVYQIPLLESASVSWHVVSVSSAVGYNNSGWGTNQDIALTGMSKIYDLMSVNPDVETFADIVDNGYIFLYVHEFFSATTPTTTYTGQTQSVDLYAYSKTWTFDWSSNNPNLIDTVYYADTSSPSQTYRIADPVLDGYEFAGWADITGLTSPTQDDYLTVDFPAGTGKTSSDTEAVTYVTSESANPRFAAVWRKLGTETFSHTFHNTSSSNFVKNSTADVRAQYSYNLTYSKVYSYVCDELTMPEPTSIPSGYTFVGWTEDADSAVATWTTGSKTFTDSTTWYAVWTAVVKEDIIIEGTTSYNVTFHYGRCAADSYASADYTKVVPYTINIERDGYYSYIWNFSYDLSSSYKVSDEPCDSGVSDTYEEVGFDNNYQWVAGEPHDDYTFIGWSTDIDAIAEWTSGTYTPADSTAKIYNFYAVWQNTSDYVTESSNSSATVTFHVGNGSVAETTRELACVVDTTYECVANYPYNLDTSLRVELSREEVRSETTYNTEYAWQAATHNNFDFVGWSTSADTSAEWTSGTYNGNAQTPTLNWYAVWSKTWTFYNTASSTQTETVNYKYNSANSQSYSNTSPTLSGYTFLGYSVNNDAVITTSEGDSSSARVTSELKAPVFYAVWKSNTDDSGKDSAGEDSYTVSFKAGSGSVSPATYTGTICLSKDYTRTATYSYNLANVVYGTKTYGDPYESSRDSVTISCPTATLSGYTLVGWTQDETSAVATWTTGSKTFTDSTTWYAVWLSNTKDTGTDSAGTSSYTITFEVGNGTVANKTLPVTNELSKDYTRTATYNYNLDESSVVYGTKTYATAEVSKYGSINYQTATHTNFNFVGWSEDDDTKNSAEWTTGSKTQFTADTTYYAVWSKTWKFYDTSATASTNIVTYAYNAAAEQTYTKSNPTLSGYTFLGYSTEDDIDVEITAGSSLTSSLAEPTFYAVWVYNMSVTPSYEADSTITGNNTSLDIYSTSVNGSLSINGTNLAIGNNSTIKINADVKEGTDANGNEYYQLVKVKINGTRVLTTSEELTELAMSDLYDVKTATTVSIVYSDAYKVSVGVANDSGVVEANSGLTIVLDKEVLTEENSHERQSGDVVIQDGVESGLQLVVDNSKLTNDGEKELIGFYVNDSFVTNTSTTGTLQLVNGSSTTYNIVGQVSTIEAVLKTPVKISVSGLTTGKTLKLTSAEGYEKIVTSDGDLNLFDGVWTISDPINSTLDLTGITFKDSNNNTISVTNNTITIG